jgi:uncharacterized membrane protein
MNIKAVIALTIFIGYLIYALLTLKVLNNSKQDKQIVMFIFLSTIIAISFGLLGLFN